MALLEHDQSSAGLEDGTWHDRADGRIRGRVGSCHQQRVARRDNSRSDARDLLRRLAGAKDDFGKALTYRSVVVDAREAQVLERTLTQILKQALVRHISLQRTTLHGFEQSSELCRIHRPLRDR